MFIFCFEYTKKCILRKGLPSLDIMTRIDLLFECGFSTKEDYDDLCKIVAIFKDRCNIALTEENGGIMITHIAAAFKRNQSGEEISPLRDSVFEDVKDSPQFALASELVEEIESQITNTISEKERKFFFLHICTVLTVCE